MPSKRAINFHQRGELGVPGPDGQAAWNRRTATAGRTATPWRRRAGGRRPDVGFQRMGVDMCRRFW